MAIERASSSKRRRSEVKADQHVEAEELRSKAERRSKKSKSSRFNIPSDALNWKPVKTAAVGGFDDGGGMMMFEELDGVDVKWEEGLNGQKTAKFIVCLVIYFCQEADGVAKRTHRGGRSRAGKEREKG